MNLFTTVNAAVTVPQAAAFCGLTIEHGDMCRCLFHADNTPSMKLNETYYYCFGCHEHGDAVSLAAKALNLRPKDAAVKLAEGFHIDVSEFVKKRGKKTWTAFRPFKPDLSGLQADIKQITEKAEAKVRDDWIEHAQNVLIRYSSLLAGWKEQYSPRESDDDWPPLFIEACRQQEKVDYMLSLTEDPADWAFFHKEYEKEVTRIERRIEEYLAPIDVGGAA